MISLSKKYIVLIAFFVPLLLILLATAIIKLPHYWAPAPKHSFVFVTSNKYIYSSLLKIESGVLKFYPKNNNSYAPKLEDLIFYRYDVDANKSEKISPEIAMQYNYSIDKRSPDGYFIRCGCDDSDNMLSLFFYYYTENKRKIYLQGHGVSQVLDIPLSNKPYTYFKFIAWIKGPHHE